MEVSTTVGRIWSLGVLEEELKRLLPQTFERSGVVSLHFGHLKVLTSFLSPRVNLFSFSLVAIQYTHTHATGMDIASYFLSFARLARRSALFWGHAVTSGITAFDGISTHGFRHMSAGSPFHGNSWENTGGVDYFVSSWLFEDQDAGRLAQRKYGERCVSRRSKIQLYTVMDAKSQILVITVL